MAQFKVTILVDFETMLDLDASRLLHIVAEQRGAVVTADGATDYLIEFDLEGAVTPGFAGGVTQIGPAASTKAINILEMAGYTPSTAKIVGIAVQRVRPQDDGLMEVADAVLPPGQTL